MRQHFEFVPEGICSKLIMFDIEDGKLYDVHFLNGCPGNLSAISKLLEGADAMKTVNILKGNHCGRRTTSCADQLAVAVEEAMNKQEMNMNMNKAS